MIATADEPRPDPRIERLILELGRAIEREHRDASDPRTARDVEAILAAMTGGLSPTDRRRVSLALHAIAERLERCRQCRLELLARAIEAGDTAACEALTDLLPGPATPPSIDRKGMPHAE